jgi:hypothetical protein
VIRRIVLKPEAELDIAEAYRWYEERDKGVRDRVYSGRRNMHFSDSAASRNVSSRTQRFAAGRDSAIPVLDSL